MNQNQLFLVSTTPTTIDEPCSKELAVRDKPKNPKPQGSESAGKQHCHMSILSALPNYCKDLYVCVHILCRHSGKKSFKE